MAKCQIKWINERGEETGDDNEAIGRVRTIERVEQIGGRGVKFDASAWFGICACHAERLHDKGMHIWIFEAAD